MATTPAPDPISLASIWNGMIAAADEVGIAIRSTAFTEAIREGDDFSVGVFDATGRMVAQGNFSPGHLGAMPFTMKQFLSDPALSWRAARRSCTSGSTPARCSPPRFPRGCAARCRRRPGPGAARAARRDPGPPRWRGTRHGRRTAARGGCAGTAPARAASAGRGPHHEAGAVVGGTPDIGVEIEAIELGLAGPREVA
jgi:hypothetical protein